MKSTEHNEYRRFTRLSARPSSDVVNGELGAVKCFAFGSACALGSEMRAQLAEALHHKQATCPRGLTQLLVLQYPGLMVRNEDGIQSRGERRVDVGPGTVANHPCRTERKMEPIHQFEISRGIFFGDNLDAAEVVLQSRTLNFSGLLHRITLGHQEEIVARTEVFDGLNNS